MRRESRDHYQEYFRGIISHLLHYFLPKEECKSKAHVHLEPELYLPHVLEVLQHFKDDEERTSSQNLLLLIDRTLRYVHLKPFIVLLVHIKMTDCVFLVGLCSLLI
jgi:hypothetical protein